MENNETVTPEQTEQVETEITETTQTEEVSTETTEDTFKAPDSQDALDVLLQAAANKANTKMLKDLEVKSVKEFKELKSTVDSQSDQFESLKTEIDDYKGKIENLNNDNNSLKQESIFNNLNVQDQYREDLTKLTLDKVSDDLSFEQVLTDMVNDKYKYTLDSTQTKVRMGAEKSSVSESSKLKAEMERLQNL